MVRATAQDYGEQQEPEYVSDGPNPDETYLIEPIGADRFQMSKEKCDGDAADWGEIRYRRKRSDFEASYPPLRYLPYGSIWHGSGWRSWGSVRTTRMRFRTAASKAKDDWEEIRGKRGEGNPKGLRRRPCFAYQAL